MTSATKTRLLQQIRTYATKHRNIYRDFLLSDSKINIHNHTHLFKMEHILIPHKRAVLLDSATLKQLEKRLSCKLTLEDNDVTVEGDSYAEYNAKNVIQAFGRGFELNIAYKLLSENYFFENFNLKDVCKTREQMQRLKSRIIGTEGKSKTYIESVSGADIAIFGSTVSTIGTVNEISVANTAIRILINGGMHKTAYKVMEKEKRKLKEQGEW